MADFTISDLSRSIQHEPNTDWPTTVKVQLHWEVGGHTRIRTVYIEADQFFGHGQYGAPMDGSALIGMIENMRKEGPPAVEHPSMGRQRKSSGTKKKR